MVHDPSRSARTRELFLQAIELPEAQRAEFLAAQCGGDADLAQEVESLLRFAIANSAQQGLVTGGLAAQVMSRSPGDRVGEFTIQRPLGSGASGDVFLASQDSPRRDVALKVLRAGSDPDTLARFRLEGAALARMSHENIARVYAVGEDAGRLYLALELVPGKPITVYADEHQLTLRERLAMFIKLCDALEHIHQNGLIHRDLKPNNVVVVETPAGPLPKVIDFGIAKSLGGAAESGDRTLDGAILGTIEYASPEQLEGSRSVDTRSDLYSTGVMLYELLIGARPHRLGDQGLTALLAAVRDEEAVLPSAHLSAAGGSIEAVAALRRATPARLLQELRTDLDWIVAKSLRKSPGERYPSAGALRADLQRYLRGEPVTARPPSRRYRLRKGLARHRAAVIVSAALVLTVTAGLIATLHQARIANAHLVELERLTTDLVSSVNDIVDIPGAIETKQRLVASAARTLESIAERQTGPALSARLADAYERVGQLRADPYTASLGQTAQGVANLRSALAIRQRLHREDPSVEHAVSLMQSCLTTAIILQSGHPGPPDADSLLRAAIAIGDSIVARDSTSLEAMRVLSMLYDFHAEYELVLGQWASTLWCIDRAYALRLAMAQQDGGADETIRLIAESHGRLAYAAADGRVSRRHAISSLEIMEGQFQRHPFSYRALLDMTFACRNAAYGLRRDGEAARGLPLLRRCVTLRRVMASADAGDLRSQHQLANAFAWLADGFVAVGRPDSAIAYARMAMEIGNQMSALPDPPPWAGDALRSHRRALGRAMRHAGRFATAESLYAIVCEDPPVSIGTDAIRAWRDVVERAHCRREAGDRAGADSAFAISESHLRSAEAFLSRFAGDPTPYADVALAYLHLARVSERDPVRRIRLLGQALSLPHYDPDERAIRPLLENELACALADQGRDAQARRLLLDARDRVAREDVRAAVRWNLATLGEGTGAGRQTGVTTEEATSGSRPVAAGRYRTRPYDPARDPYARLDLSVFRWITVWGEHPVPPPSRRVLQPAYVSDSRRRSHASPSFASPRTVRSETPRTFAVSSADKPRM